jgi:hypothetical protein
MAARIEQAIVSFGIKLTSESIKKDKLLTVSVAVCMFSIISHP